MRGKFMDGRGSKEDSAVKEREATEGIDGFSEQNER